MSAIEQSPRYGKAEAVAPGIRRVTAPNPSPMTLHGTQSYLVGAPSGPLVLVDPGPDSAAHRDALLDAAAGVVIAAILVTHSHLDHTGGVAAMKAATGAEVLAFGAHGAGMSERMAAMQAAGVELGGGEGADRDFVPDRRLADGEVIAAGAVRVSALHTPGHLGNHLSFVVAESRAVLTGDAVMGWSTTLVSPPEGDMAAQMRTLERLATAVAALPGARLLPGHGPVVEDAASLIAQQIAHRAARRRALVEALADGPATARTLATRLYTDTPPALMPAAARNVLATLLQLEEEGTAAPDGMPGPDTPFGLVP